MTGVKLQSSRVENIKCYVKLMNIVTHIIEEKKSYEFAPRFDAYYLRHWPSRLIKIL